MRHIYIRVRVMLCDCLGYKAKKTRLKGKGWMEAASLYENAYEQIVGAREVADGAFAVQLYMEGSSPSLYDADFRGTEGLKVLQNLIKEDSDIIACVADTAIANKHEFLCQALKEVRRLERKLKPMWEGRDNARVYMGDDAWFNNPAPKKEHWKMRRDDEKE